MNKRIQKGQVGLVLMVVLGLLITLILSFASRSLSDTNLARQDKEQSTTFGLAESGVEQALNAIRTGNIPSGSIALPVTDQFVSGQYSVLKQISFDLLVNEGDVAYADLSGVADGATITILWTKTSDTSENPSCTTSGGSGSAPAAIEITATHSDVQTKRYYYNPFGCSPEINGFTASSAGVGIYLSRITYVKPAGAPAATSLKIRPLYSPATISFSGLSSDQLYVIQAQAAGGDSRQEIEVKRSIAYPASVFDFALFSGGTIVK